MSSWDPGTPLRAWLRKNPKPSRIRVRTSDDEERFIELSENARNRWKAAEEAIFAVNAAAVECLDEKGNVLRATKLESDDDDGDERGPDHVAKAVSKALAKQSGENAAMLDAFGKWLTRAHEQGADAATGVQDKLVELVGTLCESLSNSIVNLHNVSTNMIEYMQEAADQKNGGASNDELLRGLLAKGIVNGEPARPGKKRSDE